MTTALSDISGERPSAHARSVERSAEMVMRAALPPCGTSYVTVLGTGVVGIMEA